MNEPVTLDADTTDEVGFEELSGAYAPSAADFIGGLCTGIQLFMFVYSLKMGMS